LFYGSKQNALVEVAEVRLNNVANERLVRITGRRTNTAPECVVVRVRTCPPACPKRQNRKKWIGPQKSASSFVNLISCGFGNQDGSLLFVKIWSLVISIVSGVENIVIVISVMVSKHLMLSGDNILRYFFFPEE
jgi:hypothetical protein